MKNTNQMEIENTNQIEIEIENTNQMEIETENTNQLEIENTNQMEMEIENNNQMEVTMSTNQKNNFSISELNYIRETIEKMNKFNQIEILRILNKHEKSITINENKNGIYINLSDISKCILDELLLYIKYVNTQELSLHNIEKQKETFKNTYFTKDNKDMVKIINNELTKLK